MLAADFDQLFKSVFAQAQILTSLPLANAAGRPKTIKLEEQLAVKAQRDYFSLHALFLPLLPVLRANLKLSDDGH
ncbi:hypothetical protein [Sphingomonas endophytica]|uniref:hypothetical protein n=1 Tax=Sphingomonas endophytica TaxID=869719 RepID=UPI00187CCE75|nr:hypothetical protein [Sphingomonas endophytica]